MSFITPALAGPVPSPSLRLTSGDLTASRFGEAVAVEGDIAIIGASGDDEFGDGAGAAYAYFRQPDGSWLQEEKLTPSDISVGQGFGFSVDVLNELVIIGSHLDDENGTDSGSAYVFRREPNGTWVEEAKLFPLDGSTVDRFGFSVSIGVGFEGIAACIGAYLDDEAGVDSGSVYIFERDFDGSWSETDKFQGIDTEDSDSFGWSVDIDGPNAVIGAYLDDDLGNGAGAVYVFRRDLLGGWTQLQKLHASDGFAVDNFGIDVAVQGTTMVVGAYLDDDNGSGSGSAYVFTFSQGSWTQAQKLTAPDGAIDDNFGRYVGVDENRIIVGALQHTGAEFRSGAAYTYQEFDGQWIMTRKLEPTSPALAGEFGHSVAVDDANAFIGAWMESGVDPQGAAYVFDLAQFGCQGDLNFDDLIDTSDLGILIGAFGSMSELADINGDGIVDTADLGLMISTFGMPCSP